jgi:peptidoglycan L-alanyl-D-glutamate endopeptidase CwlK
MPLILKKPTVMEGVHPDLVRVVTRAGVLCAIPFAVIEGVRTVERQRLLIAQGFSSLKDPYMGRHVPVRYPNGAIYGRAIDIAPLINNQPVFDNKYIPLFVSVRNAIQKAATELKIPIRSGADWKTFKDWGHHELPKSRTYP